VNPTDAPTPEDIGQYYLQVEALTPIEGSGRTDNVSASINHNIFNETFLPVILFGGFIVLSMAALFSHKLFKLYGTTRTFGSLLVVFAILAGGLNIGRRIQVTSQASPVITPKNVLVSNVTESGFAISWETEAETAAFIRVSKSGEEDLPITFFSKADKNKRHWIDATSLDSQSSYTVEVYSDNLWFNNQGQPLVVETR